MHIYTNQHQWELWESRGDLIHIALCPISTSLSLLELALGFVMNWCMEGRGKSKIKLTSALIRMTTTQFLRGKRPVLAARSPLAPKEKKFMQHAPTPTSAGYHKTTIIYQASFMHNGYKQLKNLRPWSNSVACGIEWEMSPNTSYPDCTTPLL